MESPSPTEHDQLPSTDIEGAAPVGLRLGEILRLDEIADADPALLSDPPAGWQQRAVQWVHVADDSSAASLLEGGELVLSTGPGFRDSPQETARFLDEVARAGSTGVLFELLDPGGTPLEAAERTLRAAAAGRTLPILLGHSRMRFARVTQRAHRLLVDQQLARVERINDIHDTFTRLNLEGADEQRILDEAGSLLDAPVVLENLRGQVLRFHAGSTEPSELLHDWRTRSRTESFLERTGRSRAGAPWLQSPVGARRRRWGRLILPAPTADDREASHILERAGQTLTLRRLAEHDHDELMQQARGALLQDLRGSEHLGDDEALARAGSLGVGQGPLFACLAARSPGSAEEPLTGSQLRERALRQAIDAAAGQVGSGSALVLRLSSGTLGIVLSVVDESAIDRFAQLLTGPPSGDPGISVGTTGATASLAEAANGLDAAGYIADVAASLPARTRAVYRAEDTRFRGFLAMLSDDPRASAFLRTELGPLLDPESAEQLKLLETHLSTGGVTALTAQRMHLSRPAVYARLAKLERALGHSLTDPESRTSLHAAVLLLRSPKQGIRATI